MHSALRRAVGRPCRRPFPRCLAIDHSFGFVRRRRPRLRLAPLTRLVSLGAGHGTTCDLNRPVLEKCESCASPTSILEFIPRAADENRENTVGNEIDGSHGIMMFRKEC